MKNVTFILTPTYVVTSNSVDSIPRFRDEQPMMFYKNINSKL